MQGTMKWRNAVDNMETLIEELHKEWERSGRSEAAVIIEAGCMQGINRCLGQRVMEKQSELEKPMTFQESLMHTKESFVLLRLMKKVKTAEKQREMDGICPECIMSLDHDEYKLYRELCE